MAPRRRGGRRPLPPSPGASPRSGKGVAPRPASGTRLFPTQLHDIEEAAGLGRKHIQTGGGGCGSCHSRQPLAPPGSEGWGQSRPPPGAGPRRLHAPADAPRRGDARCALCAGATAAPRPIRPPPAGSAARPPRRRHPRPPRQRWGAGRRERGPSSAAPTPGRVPRSFFPRAGGRRSPSSSFSALREPLQRQPGRPLSAPSGAGRSRARGAGSGSVPPRRQRLPRRRAGRRGAVPRRLLPVPSAGRGPQSPPPRRGSRPLPPADTNGRASRQTQRGLAPTAGPGRRAPPLAPRPRRAPDHRGGPPGSEVQLLKMLPTQLQLPIK